MQVLSTQALTLSIVVILALFCIIVKLPAIAPQCAGLFMVRLDPARVVLIVAVLTPEEWDARTTTGVAASSSTSEDISVTSTSLQTASVSGASTSTSTSGTSTSSTTSQTTTLSPTDTQSDTTSNACLLAAGWGLVVLILIGNMY